MNLENWGGLGMILALMAARGLLSAARSAFVSTRRSRLRQMALEASPGAARAATLVEDSSRLLGTLYLGEGLLVALAAGVAALVLVSPLAALLERAGLYHLWASVLSLLVVMSGLAFANLILGRLVPEAVSAAEPEKWAVRLAWLVGGLEKLFWPLVRLVVWISNRLARPFGGVPLAGVSLVTEEEIKTLVDAGEEEGVLEEEEREMIYSIFQFGETLAREVMVPRIDMVAIDQATALPDALEVIVRAGHSRIPVYENTADHIVGILYAKDLLARQRDGGSAPHLRDLLRSAYFVPETKKVDDLLREMQQMRVHMAVVVDEYGGTAGLVTVEDILEEIVGEIRDEYDVEEPVFEQVSEGEYILDARMDLDDVNRLLETQLLTESGDTLGGFMYSSLGKVPRPGERVEIDGLLMEVLSVEDRRILKIRVRKQMVEEPSAGD